MTRFVSPRFWQEFEATAGQCKVKKALLTVVRAHLTPPPTSTNVERLFSYAGMVADDHRGSLSPETVNKILFCRENSLMCNFKLEF
jgi:hypothetical protein